MNSIKNGMNMKRHYTLLLVALMAFSALAANAITREQLAQYASSLKGKKKAELKTALYQLMNNEKRVLSYGSGNAGTWWGFYVTDRDPETNQVINRYSGDVFYFGKRGEAPGGMNIEHSFPKSWWGGTKNQAYKDLYNLYPSASKANSEKGNYPMDEVVDATSQEAGYDKVGKGRSTAKAWEPGDRYKGDFARGYMYMAVTYSNLKYEKTGLQTMEDNASGYPGMKVWATTLYRQWSKRDLVDSLEAARNNAVSGIQGNRNLFVDYPHLAEYVWGDSVDVAFNPDNAISTASDDKRYGSYNPPAPPTPPTPDDSIAEGDGHVFAKMQGTLPTAGKRYLMVANTGSRLYAAKPVALANGKKFGYLYTEGVMDEDGEIELTSDNDAFTLEGADGGFRIKDSQGRYYYQEGTYSSFTPTTTVGDADVWQVTANADGTYTIKASDSGNIIMYSGQYKSFGNYPSDKQGSNLLPCLYEERKETAGIATPTRTPTIGNNAVYTLQGVRVDKPTRPGVYIRGGKKMVVK